MFAGDFDYDQLSEIKERASHYNSEYYDILTLTANEIDCGILRVSTLKIKSELSNASK